MTSKARMGAFVLASVALCVGVAAAQSTSAAAHGVVSDQTGAVLPGVTVTAKHLDTGTVRVVVTDQGGRYVLPRLPVGAYELTAELAGFQASIRRGLVLAVGQDIALNFSLGIGEVSETVVVTQEAPIVDTATPAVSTVVTSRQIREMPLNGRDFVQLATLQAGVVPVRNTNTAPDKGTGIRPSFAGARPYQTGYLLDGTDVGTRSNFRTPGSAAGVTLGVETVREFQVLVNSFSAEFGNAAGGVINAVTRSGTNRIEGSAFEFHRNSKFDAKDYFDEGDAPPPFERNQFGFTLGGPLKRDRLFWFAAYEGLRQKLSRTLIARVPTGAARLGLLPTGTVPVNPVVVPYLNLWPLPNGRDFGDGSGEYVSAPSAPTDEDFWVFRGDWTLSRNDSLYVRYSHDNATSLIYPSPVPNVGTDQKSRSRFLTVEENRVFSSSTTNMFRFAFNRSGSSTVDHYFMDIPRDIWFVQDAPGFGSFTFGSNFAQSLNNPGASGRNPGDDSMDLIQIQDTFTWTKGAHLFKFGGMVNRYRLNSQSYPGDPGGQYQFSSFQNLLAGRPNSLRISAPEAIIGRHFRQWLFAGFAVDEWRLNERVTLNLGVRYEAITVPTETDGYISALPDPVNGTEMVAGAPLFDNPSLKNFAPRVGVAWDPHGDGRMAISGGLGIYHDQIITNYLNQTANSNPPFTVRADIRNPAFPDALAALNTQGRTSSATTLNIFGPDTQQPYLIQFNVSVQRSLNDATSMTVAYVGSRGRNLQREVLVNPPTPIVQPDGQLYFPGGTPRINPNFGNIFARQQDGSSTYNSLQVRLEQRLSKGLQFQGTYTWSRSIDDASVSHGATDFGVIQVVQHPYDVHFDRGLSNFHVAHNFVVNGTWQLPWGQSLTGAGKAVLGDWQVGAIFQMSSGSPFFPIVGFDVARLQPTNNQTRPNLAPGASSNPVNPGNPDRYFDPSAFELQPLGYFGNLQRNTLIGPGLINCDLVVSKNIAVGGGAQLQLRVEVFNVFNRANFANPSQIVVFDAAGPVSSAGRITSTVTSSRQMQLGAKLVF